MAKGAYRELKAIFRRPLTEWADKFGYFEDNRLILEGREEELRRRFPATYQNILSCRHHADNRTPLAYAQDLVASWIFEDFVLDYFTSEQYQIRLCGADHERRILAAADTEATSDYEIAYRGQVFRMELVCDYGSFWKNYGKLHLRDNKYFDLQRESGLLLAISVKEKEFMLLDFRQEIPYTFIERHKPFGNKAACEVPIQWRGTSLLPKTNLEGEILTWLNSER